MIGLRPDRPTVGLITALACEYAAVRGMFDNVGRRIVATDPNHYYIGTLQSSSPEIPHPIVFTFLAQDGNKSASSVCSDLLRSFPSVRVVVMCGIAGGIPDIDHPERHVRLGDVVVATEGIIDYDHLRTIDGVDHIRRSTQGMSYHLLRAVHELQALEYRGRHPWKQWLSMAASGQFARPPDETDILFTNGIRAQHPVQSSRQAGLPKIHYAAIGSADRLLRDAVRRDAIAAEYSVRAIEMEGSGIAVGASLHDTPWFVIRGIADYCDNSEKTDAWHPYASLVAAAYVRALLEQCIPFFTPSGHSAALPSDARVVQPTSSEIMKLVDLLVEIPLFSDEASRQALIDQLPLEISGVIRRHRAPRMDALEILRTCYDYPRGMLHFIEVLDALAGNSHSVAQFRNAVDQLAKEMVDGGPEHC